MKIPIVLISGKGKTKEQLVDEVWNAFQKYFKVRKKVEEKCRRKSSRDKAIEKLIKNGWINGNEEPNSPKGFSF